MQASKTINFEAPECPHCMTLLEDYRLSQLKLFKNKGVHVGTCNDCGRGLAFQLRKVSAYVTMTTEKMVKETMRQRR